MNVPTDGCPAIIVLVKQAYANLTSKNIAFAVVIGLRNALGGLQRENYLSAKLFNRSDVGKRLLNISISILRTEKGTDNTFVFNFFWLFCAIE